MRELSQCEQAALGRLKAGFDALLEERLPVLADFMDRLGLPNGPTVVVEADAFLPAVSRYMEEQDVGADDRVWIEVRIAYFVGEWFVQKYGGCWYLNDVPDTRYFLRYVVGAFTRLANRNAQIDPFYAAACFVVAAAAKPHRLPGTD